MKKVLLLVSLLVVTAMLSSCAMFDHTTDRYDDNRNSNRGGHSHH